MEIKVGYEDVKYAILCELFRKTGMRLQPEEVEMEASDGYASMAGPYSFHVNIRMVNK